MLPANRRGRPDPCTPPESRSGAYCRPAWLETLITIKAFRASDTNLRGFHDRKMLAMALPLQLNQSPRSGVIMPWFHAVPVFGMLSMFILLAVGPEVWASRWHPGLLAAVHGITLGALGCAMLGAAQQLTAVLCGHAPVRRRRVAWTLF